MQGKRCGVKCMHLGDGVVAEGNLTSIKDPIKWMSPPGTASTSKGDFDVGPEQRDVECSHFILRVSGEGMQETTNSLGIRFHVPQVVVTVVLHSTLISGRSEDSSKRQVDRNSSR